MWRIALLFTAKIHTQPYFCNNSKCPFIILSIWELLTPVILSVTLDSIKLYVLTLLPRPPPVHCSRFLFAHLFLSIFSWNSFTRAVKILRANSLFDWGLLPSIQTSMLVGRCRILTIELERFLFWPPGPVPVCHVIFISEGLILKFELLGGGRSNTETVTTEVWRRPLFSVGGHLCTTCFPTSFLNKLRALRPIIFRITRPSDISKYSDFNPFFVAYAIYVLAKSFTNNLESSPPSPNFTSTIIVSN